MYRQSLKALATQGRAIVRDPRKVNATVSTVKSTNSRTALSDKPTESIAPHPNQSLPSQHQQQPLPFAPNEQNQSSIGSMVGSYMLAGFGMGLGMVLVRIILGG